MGSASGHPVTTMFMLLFARKISKVPIPAIPHLLFSPKVGADKKH
jgi:hypothetical protein